MAVSTTHKEWTSTELEALVVELLAAELGVEPSALRKKLEEEGDAMPVESLELFNVLVEFLKRTGLHVPKKVPPGTMRSVTRFAAFVAEQAKVPAA